METLLVKPENPDQLKAIKAVLKALNISFTMKKDKEYNKAFVAKIQESSKQMEEGRVTSIDVDDLWK